MLTASPPTTSAEGKSSFSGVELDGVDADDTQWRVTADRGYFDQSAGSGRLEAVEAFFDRDGRVIIATAQTAELAEKERFTLAGNVTVRVDGYVGTTERATYRHGAGAIDSDEHVKISGPGIEVEGLGFTVSFETGRTVVECDVHARLHAGRIEK